MKQRIALRSVALILSPLFAACMVRLESSPENEEYWDPDPGSASPSEGRDHGRTPAPPYLDSNPGAAPMTPESDPAADDAEEDESTLPDGRYRDLIVLDPEIMHGPFADNQRDDAPFSFRAQMDWLAGASGDSIEFTRAWLLGWESTSAVGAALAPVTPRPLVRSLLVDAWGVASGGAQTEIASYSEAPDEPSEPTPSEYPSQADPPPPEEAPPAIEPVSDEPPSSPEYPSDGPTSPGDFTPAWQYAPFRLIAIVNRVDLADGACSGYPGELRYVYAAIDPVTGKGLDLTLILEIPYPSTHPAAEWARRWQTLATLTGGEYTAGLAALTREIQSQADPLRVRLRSNEIALSDPADPSWEMREFRVQIHDGALGFAQVPLEFTPRADADPAILSAYVLDHAGEIEGAGVALPEELRAGAASIDGPDFSWSVLGVSDRLRRAFSVQTCNGCHGGDTPSLPFRHIGPGASSRGPARLSRFLYDPNADSDELRRRSTVIEALGATECTPAAEETPGYAGG